MVGPIIHERAVLKDLNSRTQSAKCLKLVRKSKLRQEEDFRYEFDEVRACLSHEEREDKVRHLHRQGKYLLTLI